MLFRHAVPELQGEPQDVAKEKCLMATKQVCEIPVEPLKILTVNFQLK